MASEWLHTGEQSIEVRPRPDETDGSRLQELLDLYSACGRLHGLRVVSVHALAFVSALALLAKRLPALIPAGLQTRLSSACDPVALWTMLVIVLEWYWRRRWARSAASYTAPADDDSG